VEVNVWEEQAELVLNCVGDQGANRVTRGKEIICTASKDPATAAGDVTVSGWSFDGVERSDGDPASLEWRGIMVQGGTVEVRGKLGNEPKTASATVVVSDREWLGRGVEYTFERIANGADSRLVLPDVILWSDDLGSSNWFPSETPASPAPDYTAEVLSGPNTGIDYFTDETTIRVFGFYALNSAAMSRGSRFYSAQERASGSGGTQIGGMNWCPVNVVTGSLPGLVDAHEQMHGSAYGAALTREADAALARLERTTSPDVGTLFDEYDAVWGDLDAIARAESDAIHGQPGGLVTPMNGGRPCALRNERGATLQKKPA
jgi:hypothetical protein